MLTARLFRSAGGSGVRIVPRILQGRLYRLVASTSGPGRSPGETTRTRRVTSMDGLCAINPFTQRLRVFMDRAAVQGTSPDALTVLGMSGPMATIIGIAVVWWTLSVLWL